MERAANVQKGPFLLYTQSGGKPLYVAEIYLTGPGDMWAYTQDISQALRASKYWAKRFLSENVPNRHVGGGTLE